MNDFSTNLKKYRTEKNYTQRQLAELSDIPQSAIANYETGKWSPNFHTVSALAGALNIPFDFLKPLNYDDYDEGELIHYEETRNQYIHDFYYSLDEALSIAPRVKRFDDILDEIDSIIKKHEPHDMASHLTNRLSNVYSSCTTKEKEIMFALVKELNQLK